MKIWRPLKAIFSKGRLRSKDEESLIGRIAQSVSGRDKGTVYVITGQQDRISVLVCDGINVRSNSLNARIYGTF